MFFLPCRFRCGRPLIRSLPVIGLCLLAAGCANRGSPQQDPWLARDKALHFVAGAALGAVGAELAQSNGFSDCGATASGLGLAFTVGLGKEWRDSRSPAGTASARDLLATVAGGLAGAQLAGRCGR